MTNKLDLFKYLGSLNKKDRDAYEKLSEEEQKQVAPVLILRWLSGTNDELQIQLLNEFLNPYVFPLYKHKELLSKLSVVSTSGSNPRVTWIKSQSKKTSKTPLALEVVKDYFGYSTEHAVDAMKLLEARSIVAYAEQLGRQPDEIKKIQKELNG